MQVSAKGTGVWEILGTKKAESLNSAFGILGQLLAQILTLPDSLHYGVNFVNPFTQWHKINPLCR